MRTIFTLTAALGLAGCATIMHGTTQDIGLQSTPTNAKVTVDGLPMGSTPVVTKLSRKDNHIVKLTLDGYQPFEATITRGTSGWVWGNIVFGGLVGLAVDAMSGGLYTLNPAQVSGQMTQGAATRGGPPMPALDRDGVYIAVVLHADPSWQQVGSLVKSAP